jgi:hypothetical protein
VTETPNDAEKPAPSMKASKDRVFENQTELKLPSMVKTNNYIWARPCAWLVENGSTAANQGGSHRVPRVGTVVLCFFEGADPNKPYWMPFTPTVVDDALAGRELGKGLNTEATAANWKDAKRRVEVNVLAEHDNGNVVLIDNNPDSNSFVVRWNNGHTLVIGHAAESGIVLKTEKGHLVQLDENSKEIRIRTHTGKSDIVISDTGDVTITNAASTRLTSAGPIEIVSSEKVSVAAPSISLNG